MAEVNEQTVTVTGPIAGSTANRTERLGEEHYLRIDSVRKEFDGFVAVDNVSLSIRQGEIFALLGASGCGKSTLLRMLAGFEQASAGTVTLDGTVLNGVPPYQRPVNMMFQSYALFPHMSVEQNVAFGLKQDGLPKEQIREKVARMLSLVHMESMAKRKPHQLSGGQQQRVALARSLAKSPKLLLLDEPMGALDKKLRGEMQLEVVNIIERLGVTCVMVTHDQEEAMTMAHRIAVMDAGRIRQVGTPDEIYEQPANRFTAEFIGSVNLVEGKIDEDQKDYITIRAPILDHAICVGHGVTGYEGQEVALALRPEKLVLSKDEPAQRYNKTRGVIEDIAYFGSHSVYHVRLPGGERLMANSANAQRWASDRFTWEDEIWLSWDDQAGVVLTS
ncbi:MAG: polyamine ABC transporter ATP-binding protein [Xanthomonadaceae bacterium]|nr:polyamine ABC transporter ATP-binding protein [Xanthomonadaceae bacterium]MDP2184187.1 polyamine ABC transporter ATP-binding protein [Xanthomonadales bacterium]MDZ4114732.1 polyamine ABC transporter ATP-binding protein [Xanthomonadaceae bacterium]MDZ4377330.1 polyamine ABC transporter ATP-binding protein [Xanthomonadaceae bacterium]